MQETIDFEKTVAALSPQQRELLASRLKFVSGQDSQLAEHDRLLAYVVPKSDHRPSAAELLRFLKEQLPDYMVPADCIVVEEWPKTPGGKIDLQALSSPRAVPAQSKAGCTPPQTALEEVIAQLWHEVLAAVVIGKDDNFFDLGGHSLLLMKVNLKLKQHCRREISLVEMFKYPTISSLAAFLNGQQNGDSPDSLQKIHERATTRRETAQQLRMRRQEHRSSEGAKELYEQR